jgi:kanamycin nucleotidyltransferase
MKAMVSQDSTVKLKAHNHEERVNIAKQLSAKIVEKHGDKILAVCIWGSTAKKLDRAYSDLEMLAILRDGVELPAINYLYQGMVVGIDYYQETDFLKDAHRVTGEWALAADQFRNRIPLYDPTGWFSKLDSAVASSDKVDTSGAIRHRTTGLYEGLEVMKNAKLSNDEVGVRTAGFYFAWDVAKLILLINKKYILTSSWFWKEARECLVKPDNFWKHIETLASFTKLSSTDEIIRSAEYLADEMRKIAASQGLSIESAELAV